jgi:hypothetical protein
MSLLFTIRLGLVTTEYHIEEEKNRCAHLLEQVEENAAAVMWLSL